MDGKNYIVRNWLKFSQEQEKTIDYWPSEGSNYIDTIHVSCNNILIGWKPRAHGYELTSLFKIFFSDTGL